MGSTLPPCSTSCVLSAKWQQIVCCELRLNNLYVPKLICLSFHSNFSYQIQMQISWTNLLARGKCVMRCFQNDFTLPPVQPSVNIELTSLSEAGCEAIWFKRNNLAGPSRLWHNLNAAMSSQPLIFKLRSVVVGVFLRPSHPRCC